MQLIVIVGDVIIGAKIALHLVMLRCASQSWTRKQTIIGFAKRIAAWLIIITNTTKENALDCYTPPMGVPLAALLFLWAASSGSR